MSPSPAGPPGAVVACAGCGSPLDGLRAGHVALFGGRLLYFCSYAVCRAAYLRGVTEEVEAAPPRHDGARPKASMPSPVEPREPPPVPAQLEVDEAGELFEPVAPVAPSEIPDAARQPRRELGMLLLALTLVAGALAMALELGSGVGLVRVARVVLIGVGAVALVGWAVSSPRDPTEPHWLVVVAPPALALVVAAWALLSRGGASRHSFLAATIVTAAALSVWLVGLAQRPVLAGRRWVAERLDVPGRRVAVDAGALSAKELSFDLSPGDQLLVDAGETVPVDLEILEGEVEVLAWVGASTRARRRAGDVVVAGSRVTAGTLRGVCLHAGDERALCRSILCERRRADVHGDVPRLSRLLAERGAPAAGVLAGAMLAVADRAALDVVAGAVAVYAALGNLAVGSLTALAVARGVRVALGRGVIYNDARAFQQCAATTVAVFCARGTLVRGEPELSEIELFSRTRPADLTTDDVLALAAGLLMIEDSPLACALRRACERRGVRPAPVRNPRALAGLGVTGVAASGELLCVGSRDLMVERKISVAAAEKTIYELEHAGRTVILVARAGRLAGLVALQDGLRAGARAAVQHLLDAHIEPVLMSADSRDTAEALGRALDIDHLRPGVASDRRAEAVQRLADAGATVAVLGHTPHDDQALGAGQVSIALCAAGRQEDSFDVTTVSDDVRDATLALALAQRTRREAVTVLALMLAPAALGALVVTLGLLPFEFAPLAQLVGVGAAVIQLRGYDR